MMKKWKSSRGDSSLIIFVIAIPLIMVFLGFSVDVSKSINAGNAYKAMSQNSAETAVKSVNANGSLNNASVKSFVNEYKNQANPSDSHTNETNVYKSKTCDTAVIDGVERKLPYMVIKLGTDRSIDDKGVTTGSTWTVENYQIPEDKQLGSTKYKVISADVYDSSTNFFGIFGLPACQVHQSTVSAISFASNEDLDENS